jgi:hypothetical protein
MNALTVYQPHAMALAIGLRTIETRGWPTAYRGPLLIHAAKQWDGVIAEDCRIAESQIRGIVWSRTQTKNQLAMANTPWRDTLGCVLAVAVLSDCVPIPEPCGTEFDKAWGGFGPGRYGFVLTELRTLSRPVPAVGKQKLWVPDAALVEECLALAEGVRP